MCPSISIVIPSFNQGPFIERTLLSILRQQYPGEVEIIVSDGGSTDQTVPILRAYPQVRWWSERDHGIADAINKGLSVARGDIIAIQSSDDYYLPKAFARTIECLHANDHAAIVSGCDVYLQPDGRNFSCSALDEHQVDPRSLMLRRVFPQHCTFFRREVIDRVGLLDTHIAEGAEIDFWYRALHHFSGRFFPWHTAVYQLHPQQRTQTGRRWYESLTGIIEHAENDPELGAIFRMSPDDKFNLYLRWQIQTAALAGRDDDVAALLSIARRDSRVTSETLDALALHGFLPRQRKPRGTGRHPNHTVPAIDWWRKEISGQAAA